jgi:uncharacterized protein (DUF1919 family)
MTANILRGGLFFLKEIRRFIDRKRYNSKPFVIVANNCWGAEIYKYLECEYNTPFIGLFLYPQCFLKLLSNWEYYINSELTFTTKSKYSNSVTQYPIGELRNDVQINFMHYNDDKEAYDKWTRRLKRMNEEKNMDRFFFKFDDREGGTSDMIESFHQLEYKNKISFTASPVNIKGNINLKAKHHEGGEATSGVNLFAIGHNYFDVVHWLNRSEIRKYFL